MNNHQVARPAVRFLSASKHGVLDAADLFAAHGCGGLSSGSQARVRPPMICALVPARKTQKEQKSAPTPQPGFPGPSYPRCCHTDQGRGLIWDRATLEHALLGCEIRKSGAGDRGASLQIEEEIARE